MWWLSSVVYLKDAVPVGVQIRGLIHWLFVQELIHCCNAVFVFITVLLVVGGFVCQYFLVMSLFLPCSIFMFVI